MNKRHLSLSGISFFPSLAARIDSLVFLKSRIMNRKIVSCALALSVFFIASTADAQSLRGSPASVERIHRQAINHGLRFFESGGAIRDAAQRGELVRLRDNADFRLHDVSYPYVLPDAHTFVARLASQYRAACGEQMVVTSATRPTAMRLVNSVVKSVHPTGMAVDLRRPSNSRCLSWLRSTLSSLTAAGVIEAVEERNPPHFHVAVFPSQYNQYVRARTGGSSSGQLAAAPRPAPTTTGARRYEVRRGDSLWTIARRNNLTVERLREANNLSGSRILAGQILEIPAR